MKKPLKAHSNVKRDVEDVLCGSIYYEAKRVNAHLQIAIIEAEADKFDIKMLELKITNLGLAKNFLVRGCIDY